MNKLYTKTIIFLFALIFAIGIIIPFDLVHKSIDILEGVGQGFSNLHTLYINSSDSSPDGGIVEDTVQDDDPEDSVLAVDETFDEVLATITAYTSSVEETDNTPCMSASGLDLCLTAGIWVNDDQEFFDDTQFIACPKRYPFKTIVEIPFRKIGERCNLMMEDCVDIMSDRRYICLDRMNSRYDGEERFDIYFGQGEEAYQKAINWGVQKKLIKIYNNL